MYEDQGYDLHIVHANKPKFTAPPGFTGAFHPQTGAMVPMFKEKDGFWYLYYVVAQNAKEAYDRIRAGNDSEICSIGEICSIWSLELPTALIIDMASEVRRRQWLCKHSLV